MKKEWNEKCYVEQDHQKNGDKSEQKTMIVVPYTDDLCAYLVEDEVINFSHDSIAKTAQALSSLVNDEKANAKTAQALSSRAMDEIAYIKAAYEFVRDEIAHSADVNEDLITCSASEVLAAKHGICMAKSHLLAALLRYKGIPAGFCYQRLILDDETAPILVYHGLNGVYVQSIQKWIRLDARGNKEGVHAQFSLEKEQLAFPVRKEKGEEDCLIVFPKPDQKVLDVLRRNKTRTQLWDDLPTELAYLEP